MSSSGSMDVGESEEGSWVARDARRAAHNVSPALPKLERRCNQAVAPGVEACIIAVRARVPVCNTFTAERNTTGT